MLHGLGIQEYTKNQIDSERYKSGHFEFGVKKESQSHTDKDEIYECFNKIGARLYYDDLMYKLDEG